MNAVGHASSVTAAITAHDPERLDRVARDRVGAAQRLRIISAMVALASDRGAAFTTVSDVVDYAGVSRKTFYELFEDRGDCMLAAVEHAFMLAGERATAGCDGAERWVERVRGGLAELLRFFDEEPQLAQVCIVQSAAAGPDALACRGEVLLELARVVDQGRVLARRQPPPLTAEGVVGGVLGVITTRLLTPGAGSMIDLLNLLMSLIVLPYRGHAVALKEQCRTASPHAKSPRPGSRRDVLDDLPIRLTHRTMAVLATISNEPGLSNLEISERVGINDQGQISKLLARLSQRELTVNAAAGEPRGGANEWRLTSRGEEIQAAIRRALVGIPRDPEAPGASRSARAARLQQRAQREANPEPPLASVVTS